MTSDQRFSRDFLRRVHPFSLVSEESLDTLLRDVAVRHFPAREALPPMAGVVLRGALQYALQGVAFDMAFEGDAFGFESVLDTPLPRLEIRASEDCAVLAMGLDALQALMDREKQARVHFTRRCERLAMLLEGAKARAAELEADPFLRLAVGGIQLDPPVFVPADMNASEAARIMRERNVSACLVGRQGHAEGILTERDVVAQAARGVLDVPVGRMMTSGLITVRGEEFVFEAFSKMVRHGIRRLVVVDADGAPQGLLQERDMLSARGENPLRLAGDVAAAGSVEDLARSFGRLRSMVLRCAAERIEAGNVGRLVAHTHDGILVRLAGLIEDGLGPAPREFSLMVLGSEGRREQFLATDQDNAIVFDDSDSPDDASYFEEFGRRFVRALVDIGFPPCPHAVTVDNPLWRQSLPAWRENVAGMLRVVDADAVLRLAQLADARLPGSEEAHYAQD